jgi:nitrogen fixation protein FixH
MVIRLVVTAGLVAVLASSVLASQVRVRTKGAKSQSVQMCADCKKKITCAAAGDYLIGLTADVGNTKVGTSTFVVHVLDKAKKPVTDAEVSIALDMPKHKHSIDPIVAKHISHGKYVATNNGGMPGAWVATVSVAVGGDTVKQAFTFSR